ncbi:hypothetical protein IV203_038588 [Nitzschia inconspicua]|uniref:Uncharacterized protein n=1 Tax=Nitzschia inconspicua TaxID=303405 RepID=A0A9K3LNW3_9STRA|nr:hypothetical protein IV203_038588 [Nitzschia inconspicua]
MCPAKCLALTRLLLVLALPSWLVCLSSAFMPGRMSHPDRHSLSLTHSYDTSALLATLYGKDGKIVRDDEQEQKQQVTTDIFDDVTSSMIRESVQSDLGDVNALLTRLACGFAPSPHDHLLPRQVVSATLKQVTPKQLSIAVAVPAGNRGGSDETDTYAGDQLVQILVPVVFQKAVKSDGEVQIVKSVIKQIQQLDQIATDRLIQREKQKEEDSAKQRGAGLVEQELQRDLTEEPLAVDWPSWWTVPQLKIMLAEECKTLKSLLNEAELSNELVALCKLHSSVKKPIRQAKVAAVGTSGIFLRATLLDDNENDITIVNVPIPFPGGEMTTSDDLRESVLTLIETVELLQEETPAEEPIESPSDVSETIEIRAEEEEATEAARKMEEETRQKEPTQEEIVAEARKQPKSPEEEARLAAKYAAIADVGERAFTILKDLGMI